MRFGFRVSVPIALIALTLTLAGCSGAPSSARTSPGVSRAVVTPAAKPARSDAVVLTLTSPSPTVLTLATPIAAPADLVKTQESATCRSERMGDLPLAMVRGTNGQGLWVRTDPAGEPVMVAAEGARLTLGGEACLADGRWWMQVQTQAGQTGWAAIDYLVPADEAAGAPPPAQAASRTGSSSTSSTSQAVTTPTPRPAPPAPTTTPVPTKTPVPAMPTASPTPAATRVPTMAPLDFPPVSQLDPLLRPAYEALVTLPKIGPAFADIVKKSRVRFAVAATPGDRGNYNGLTNVITVDPETLENDPRAVAAVLAHEITHATQTARGQKCSLPRELEAHKVGINVWESFWSNETPPEDTDLERQLGRSLVKLREGGDPGLLLHLLEIGYTEKRCPNGADSP